MNPRFWNDLTVVGRELRYYRNSMTGEVFKEYRVHGLDAAGEVLLGAKSASSFDEAHQRLADFIDGELARRAISSSA